ncbi:hypothetical protein HA49_02650 [Tatumella morbirosei]|uniref:N-acetyltransferase domain-containing protein n=1 Tax=Tatumella morbirosei TaxID=642227 RepID=A0A095TS71_9GAMM|nr:aspartate 1-decarboxylase autocleavage activator PanM [Tatumella morbirosei]KGD79497.1 hypothetical protein HA49_02650 [Tatumella morbirosei]
MRLTIELLQHPSPAELACLSKIWPEKASAGFLQHQDDIRWYVARFNQRLLAGLELQLRPSEAVISQIMVREITRRRGVGRYLLEETLRINPDIHRWKICSGHLPLSEAASQFLYACGFRLKNGQWFFSR